jgi:hypothetical protein
MKMTMVMVLFYHFEVDSFSLLFQEAIVLLELFWSLNENQIGNSFIKDIELFDDNSVKTPE